jgi:HprK-related kinase A
VNQERPDARLASLSDSGVQLAVGPFLVRVSSDLSSVRDHLSLFYSDFPIGSDPVGHFDVALFATGGVRRLVRPQANLAINGDMPFLPLPATLGGASLEWAMNWCFGQRALNWVVIHAAVVERAGRVVVLSAPSGSGKSTLCAALSFAGWRLFSDEFALIDPRSGLLFPAPRPLSLKDGAIEIIKQRHPEVVYGPEGRNIERERFVHVRPPADAVKRASESAKPGWIVIPRYVPGAATTFEPLARARAVVEIADQSFNYNHLGPSGYDALVNFVAASECYRLEYSNLDDLLPRLQRMTAE